MRWIYLFLILAVCNIGWYGPKTSNALTASQDVVANSSDTHAVGTSANYWRRGFFAYHYMSEHLNPPAAVSSFGVVWVSTDNHLYFTNDSGSSTQIDD